MVAMTAPMKDNENRRRSVENTAASARHNPAARVPIARPSPAPKIMDTKPLSSIPARSPLIEALVSATRRQLASAETRSKVPIRRRMRARSGSCNNAPL
ncbi:MAG: hypothetical protein M3O26_21370 [Pseudomonadota bacterium]|nr:hypothetical protein [Pseudomonadota bacterium]